MSLVKLNVKKGDTVVVLSGKDKGKQGKVIAAMPKKGKVVVEGVNKVKRHTKPNQKAPQGDHTLGNTVFLFILPSKKHVRLFSETRTCFSRNTYMFFQRALHD